MDAVLPLVYNFIESIHFFIPLIAIFVCIVIFAFSTIGGSSKNQPPEEYLNEIRASSSPSTKNVSRTSRPKTIKTVKVSSQKQASPTKHVEEQKKPLDADKKKEKHPELTEKQRKKREKQQNRTGHKSDDEWITVTNSKQKKVAPVDKLASKSNSDIKSAIKNETIEPKIIKNSISDVEDTLDLGSKDSRYKKQNVLKRRVSEKGSPDSQTDVPATPTKPAAPQQEEFTTVNNARKRKTVRREN